MQNPTGILANGSYIDAPLGGYQYPQIHAVNGYDPDFVYLSANLDCPAFDTAVVEWTSSPQSVATQNATSGVYTAVGSAMLNGVVNTTDWSYAHAYALFDYINYQNTHNNTAAAELAGSQDAQTHTGDISTLQWLADEQQYAELGNLTAPPALPNGLAGSISTIAGNMLAALILDQFSDAILTGQLSNLDPSVDSASPTETANPTTLTLLFADFHPFLSFFALAGLPHVDAAFTGLPQFGSSAVFELFTYVDPTTDAAIAFPASTDNLWVRFYFRNGTDPDTSPYQSFPLFGNSPSNTDLPWVDFQSGLHAFALGDIGAWCTSCQAVSLFCAAWNASDSSSDPAATSISRGETVGSVLAGVIGAIVGLSVACLALVAAMLGAGVRLHRVPIRRASGFGGFKGSQKMRSDQDLSIPKGGAAVSTSVEEVVGPMSPVAAAHERIGSWELKQPAAAGGLNVPMGERLPSMDDDRDADVFSTPTRAFEQV